MHSPRSLPSETKLSDSFNSSEEFNDRILCPDLSDTEKTMLHEEVKKIYETYCLDESVDKIRFDPFIVEEIRNSITISKLEFSQKRAYSDLFGQVCIH